MKGTVDRHAVRRLATIVAALAGIGAVACAAAPAASAELRQYWVAAVPAPTWNMVAQRARRDQRRRPTPLPDGLPDGRLSPLQPALGSADAQQVGGSSNQDLIPGPLLRARVGDRIYVHFKNLDTLFKRPHSMHFHGVHYRPSSDGAYVPGFSGRDGDVKPGQTWTYKLTAGSDSVGVWPYHDHSPSMDDSIAGGMYGMLSILGRHEQRARPRVRGRVRPDGRLPDDRRPRVRRQHARVPSIVGQTSSGT